MRPFTSHLIDFNPRLPRGRRHPALQYEQRAHTISIHASLAGGDDGARRQCAGLRISIHASLAGGDLRQEISIAAEQNFNPRLPRGRRPPRHQEAKETPEISIHASLAGGDNSRFIAQ